MKTNKNQIQSNEMDADVLYQKLGDRWFAFSLIGDEVFMSPVDEETINNIRAEQAAPHNIPNETI